MARAIRDSYGKQVTAGCEISFSYGIPPVLVRAPIIDRGGQLIAMTPGHNPPECPASRLKACVGDFWITGVTGEGK